MEERQESLLNSIRSLSDFKQLPEEQLPELAKEIRSFLVSSVSKTGGHLASNLGVVELTFALERVFDSPKDKIVFDVGHQSYVHKILTGRREGFATLRTQGGISGFPKTSESEHDAFNTGHASTSVSAALGMARAKKLKGEEGSVVAVIGDGALSGGLAYEALNDAGQSKLPIIVVLNDNEMSIAKNVGGMSVSLSNMRLNSRYLRFKRAIVRGIDKLPNGNRLFKKLERTKNRIKFSLLPNVLFEAMGFTYLGPMNGHDTKVLIHFLRQAKMLDRPVLIHAVTKKGLGYSPAERNPEKFHGIGRFDPETGETPKKTVKSNSEVFGETLCALAEENPHIVAVTAAMPLGTGLTEFQRRYPDRFFDVGIAEEHAVTMAAGMAREGLRPVAAIYSSFLQRAYDQILHDVCLQSLPVVLAVDRAGLVGEDGETHQGVFDNAFLREMPGLTMYSPCTTESLRLSLREALSLSGPASVRYHRGALPESLPGYEAGLPFQTLRPVTDAVILVTGRLTQNALAAAQACHAGVIAIDRVRPIPEGLLPLLKNARLCLVIEEGSTHGGLGSEIAALLSGEHVFVKTLGTGEFPAPQGTQAQQDVLSGFLPEQIAESVNEMREFLHERNPN